MKEWAGRNSFGLLMALVAVVAVVMSFCGPEGGRIG